LTSATTAVGIDLGTTHCALASVELAHSPGDDVALSQHALPQVIAPGQVEARALLPSFLYVPHPSELEPGALTLPWAGHPTDRAVGEVARVLGSKSALRLVSSAKSWLCHAGVDRRAPILPAGAPAEVSKVSPLEASVQYLAHLRSAWDHAHPGAPLAQQLVTITVPASFDPVARELTAEAARHAGLPDAVLLEEPQAAMYSWIAAAGRTFREQVQVGDVILVVDVGGGTSDFSLIAVRDAQGDLQLERVAVGEHILLGGDNMDLALAYFLKGELEQQGHKLDAAQVAALTQAARVAKEQLLGDATAQSAPVTIPGRGSKLVGGTIRAELTRADIERLLLEGFFPVVDAAARPVARPRAGLTQLGLPYAQDAAITRHLAAFLARQAGAVGDGAAGAVQPTALLFNGGVFKSALLRERVRAVLDGFLAQAGAQPVRVLEGADLDLAVARGAAYYGHVRSGHGIRIRGGTAMSYYVGVESAMPAVPGMPPPLSALCVAPFGLEEGTRAEMPETELGLIVGEPVRFHFFGSSVRREDRAGAILDAVDEEELRPLQDIEVTLPSEQQRPGEAVVVRLQAGVTEVGTLQVEAVSKATGVRWKVELDTR
jgi:molecular chaperone DnaK (HSP70)